MQLNDNQIEVFDLEEVVHIHLDEVYELTFDQLKVNEFVEAMVEDCFTMSGGYAEHYSEVPCYASEEDYLERHSYNEVVKEILEDYTKEQLIKEAKLLTDD